MKPRDIGLSFIQPASPHCNCTYIALHSSIYLPRV